MTNGINGSSSSWKTNDYADQWKNSQDNKVDPSADESKKPNPKDTKTYSPTPTIVSETQVEYSDGTTASVRRERTYNENGGYTDRTYVHCNDPDCSYHVYDATGTPITYNSNGEWVSSGGIWGSSEIDHSKNHGGRK